MVACIQLLLNTTNYRQLGVLAPEGLRITQAHHTPRDLADHCLRNGLTAGYGTYWISYHLTFLTNEAVILAPYRRLHERKPPDYTRRIANHRNPFYVFLGVDEWVRQRFEARLKSRGLSAQAHFFPGFALGIILYESQNQPLPHNL
jgi:hypothetical protein